MNRGRPVDNARENLTTPRGRNSFPGDRLGHWRVGGARRDRTDDLLLAKQALSQLSYGPPECTGFVLVCSGKSPEQGALSANVVRWSTPFW